MQCAPAADPLLLPTEGIYRFEGTQHHALLSFVIYTLCDLFSQSQWYLHLFQISHLMNTD